MSHQGRLGRLFGSGEGPEPLDVRPGQEAVRLGGPQDDGLDPIVALEPIQDRRHVVEDLRAERVHLLAGSVHEDDGDAVVDGDGEVRQ